MGLIGILTTLSVPDEPWRQTLPGLDKLLHFLLYVGLGWFLGRAAWLSGRPGPRAVWAALLSGLLFAALDEWHQAVLPTRDASLADWLADTAGLSVGLLLYVGRGMQGGGAGVAGEPEDPDASGEPGGTDAAGEPRGSGEGDRSGEGDGFGAEGGLPEGGGG
ncbi:MAG: VanZ family protein [Gemmatimonadota bacterium]